MLVYTICEVGGILLFISFNILGCLCGCNKNEKCGSILSNKGNYKVEENNVGVVTYPWAGVIFNNKRSLVCAGSIITSKHALTAARCIVNTENTNLHVSLHTLFSTYDFCKPEPERYSLDIAEYYVHDDYKNDTNIFYNDIGIIRFIKETVLPPVCLPCEDFTVGLPVLAVAWGHSNVHPTLYYSCTQRFGIWTTVEDDWCKETKTICGFTNNSVCLGDSGGPVLTIDDDGKYVLNGVISFGPLDCNFNLGVQVATNVYLFLPWIKEIINKSN